MCWHKIFDYLKWIKLKVNKNLEMKIDFFLFELRSLSGSLNKSDSIAVSLQFNE
jgi:hypothetical protein